MATRGELTSALGHIDFPLWVAATSFSGPVYRPSPWRFALTSVPPSKGFSVITRSVFLQDLFLFVFPMFTPERTRRLGLPALISAGFRADHGAAESSSAKA